MSLTDKTLLEKYMRGECTPEEEALVHQWLDENDAADYPDVHKEIKYRQKEDDGWARLSGYLEDLQMVPVRKVAHIKRTVWFAAASTLILFGSVLAYYKLSNSSSYGQEYKTSYGEIKRLNLKDGTTVTLNAKSTLKIFRNFGDKKRQVHLTGEAYFRVKHNDSLPFIVHSDRLSVTALGTSFDVSAFSDDPNVAVALEEGKVLVQANDEETKLTEDVVLLPGEEVIYNKHSAELKVEHKFNQKERLNWQSQVIYFENADMNAVIRKLERFYGVSFDTRRLKKRNWQLKGEYRNETLKDVLESLSYGYNLQYKIEGKEVVLYEH